MPYFEFLWTRENARHIADEHGVSTDDFEAIVQHSTNRGFSRRSLLPVAWGYTDDGKYIMAGVRTHRRGDGEPHHRIRGAGAPV